MNIFVQDEEERSNASGLPGNEPSAVLHTSFSTDRSSSDIASNKNGIYSQTSAAPALLAIEQTSLQPSLSLSQGQTQPHQMVHRTILPKASSHTVPTINNRGETGPPAHGGIRPPRHATVLGPRAAQSVSPTMPATHDHGSVASTYQPGLHVHGSPGPLAPQSLPLPASLQHLPIHVQSHTQQPLPNQPYQHHSALQHSILKQQPLHQPVSHQFASYQQNPAQPNLDPSIQYGNIEQAREQSRILLPPPQPRRQVDPIVHQQSLHESNPHLGGLAHQPCYSQLAHTQSPVRLSSFEQPTIPEQALAHPPQQQTLLQHTHRQAVQQSSGPISAAELAAIRQAQPQQEPGLTQPEVNQQSTSLQAALQQPIQVPQIVTPALKRVQVEELAAVELPAKVSSLKTQSTEQLQIKSRWGTSSQHTHKFIQVTGPNGNRKGKKRAIVEELVDYLPSGSSDPIVPDIPTRLLHGGIIRPRPELMSRPHDDDKTMDSGISKHLGQGGETTNNSTTSHPSKLEYKLKKSDRNNIAQQRKVPKCASASRVLRDTREEAPQEKDPQEKAPQEKAALNSKAQKAMKQDEENSKRETGLEIKEYEPQPTADAAMKARNGMTREEIASEVKFDIKKLEKNERKLDAAEKERSSLSENELAATGLQLDENALINEIRVALKNNVLIIAKRPVKRAPSSPDFFERISNYPEIVMEITKYLKPKDLVKLYSISKPFHTIVSSFLAHTMQLTAKTQASESASVFRFKFYGELCAKDPGLRSHPRNANDVRMVPSPRWLQMVVHRDKTIRDILALLARQGHRMQESASLSLKKMWLLMDVATTRQRVQLLHSPYFTDKDIFNMQMFFIKLDMRFNNPYAGPASDKLRKVMLGQRGLTPLRNLLKRKIGRTEIEVAKIGIRYAYHVNPKYRGIPIFDIPPEEIGVGHLEGWGKGAVHLFRPDELVVREAVRRRLNLKGHIMGMMIWGYIDPRTGKNIEVTDDEKYMSESEHECEEYEAWNDEWESDSEEKDSDTDRENLLKPKD